MILDDKMPNKSIQAKTIANILILGSSRIVLIDSMQTRHCRSPLTNFLNSLDFSFGVDIAILMILDVNITKLVDIVAPN